MTKEEIFKELKIILREIFKEQEFTIDIEDKISNIQGWDSLSHVNIIGMIEDKFNIRFTMGEIVTLKTVAELIDLIKEKL